MIARLASSALAAAALCAIVSGCSAPAEPVEPTPVFTSEEHAFAAAEETYRAYVDALNAVDLSDPETFEDVFAWTTGELNASDREGLSEYHAAGASVTGESVPVVVDPGAHSEAETTLAVCVDISTIEVTDANGTSLVQPDRVPVQSIEVTLKPSANSTTGMLISAISGREGEPSC